MTIIPNFPEFGIETRYFNKILKAMANIYGRLINQFMFKYHTIFSARVDKQDEDNQVLDETYLFIDLNIIHKLTESGLDKIHVKSPLEHQIQQQEMKDSGKRFDKINSMTIYFYKTGEINGSSYLKIPLRSTAILNIENDDNYCSIWSILAKLNPCNENNPNRVSNYQQNFTELNIEGFDFTNGFKCSDVFKIEKINNLSINIIELNFHQDQKKWRHKFLPIEK